MEPIDRLPSPWTHDSSPLPSPGPPPSPAVWMPHDWTPGPRNTNTSRTLPLIPEHPGQRSHYTYSALPTHPDFLRGLQSHPLINQQADDVYLTPSTPSPTSSDEYVMTARPEEKAMNMGPVPFPMSSGYSSPVMSASPRPLPSVGSSQPSVRSLPSIESSPARTPDSAAALSSSIAMKNLAQSAPKSPPPPHVRPQPSPPALPKLQLRPPPEPQAQPQQLQQHISVPPPPPLPQATSNRNSNSNSQPQAESRPQPQRANTAPGKHPVTAPRPRLPALRGSTGSIVLPPRPQSAESTCPKHTLFYMHEGMIVLRVEGALYRVHKYLLEQHSDFFRGFLSDDEDSMGHSDERPIPLPENVTQQGFDTLLNFLYTGIYDPMSVSLSDWVTLLRISTLLQFTKVRQYAIRELTTRRTSLQPIDAILLAKEHDIPSWLGPAYAELVRRPTLLDDDEAERLGARMTAQIGRAREMLRQEEYAQYQQRRYGARYIPPERLDEQLVARAVNEVFKLPNNTSDAQGLPV